MAYQKFTGTYQSSDHINRIHYYIYEPETDLRAILQIVHDFGDFVERNENLFVFLQIMALWFADVTISGMDVLLKKRTMAILAAEWMDLSGKKYKKADTLYEKRISRYTVFYLWTRTGISHCANGLYP